MLKIRKNTQCRICKGTEFREVINFGETPLLVNNLLTDPNGVDPVYPLLVEQCQKCFLVQIRDTVEASDLYQKQDYLFFSSDMPNLADYFKEFADSIKEYITPDDLTVEIGSNDGVFLQHLDCRVLGVDPATNVVLRALKKGIPTISGFFDEITARRIKDEWGQAKLITGFNCVAHIDDLDNLMRGVQTLLSDDGVFVAEVNYWGDMVKNRNYGLIYHDHFSYFTLRDWINYAPKFGLNVFDAMIPPAQGDISNPELSAEAFNIRIFMDRGKRPLTERTEELFKSEVDLDSFDTVEKYAKDIKADAKKLGNLIRRLSKEHTIAGYGASAKAFSIFQLAGIDETHIDYFVDDSKAKQNKYAPITHIPIYPRGDRKPDYFLITAPNYINVIIEKEKEFIKNGGKFITIKSEII